ncbi:MAG: VanZ family protein [Dehalococcoidia bacterium]
MPGSEKGTAPPEKAGPTVGQRPVELHRWLRRLISTGLAVAWMGLIFQLSSLSPGELPSQFDAFVWMRDLRSIAGHLVLYGVLGPLLLFSLWSWATGSVSRSRWALVAIGLGVLYGVTDEFHQSFVTGRIASGFDVFVDTVGVVCGVAGVWLLARAAQHRRARG